jgi:hypothetical protein
LRPAALALLAALVPASALARPLPRYGAFVYSDLCWGKESGDANGFRFALSRTRRGATLTVEYGNGPLEGARITSLRMDGDRFEATATTSDGDLTLSGALGRQKAMLLSVFDFQKARPPGPKTLKRIKSFGQRIPQCRS